MPERCVDFVHHIEVDVIGSSDSSHSLAVNLYVSEIKVLETAEEIRSLILKLGGCNTRYAQGKYAECSRQDRAHEDEGRWGSNGKVCKVHKAKTNSAACKERDDRFC